MAYYSAIKNNKIMPLVATRVDLKTTKLDEVSHRKTNDATYMQNLNKHANELIYRAEIDSQT